MVTPVNLEASGEHDLFVPTNNRVPEAITDPEGKQEPFVIVPDIEEVMPVSTMVNSRERTRKNSSRMRESIAQGLTSPLILSLEAVVKQQLDEIFPFKVSHNWFLQEEENMSPLVA